MARERERPAVVGRLDEEIPRIPTEPEPAQLIHVQLAEPLDRDLAARPHLERNVRALELGLELRDALFHRGGSRRVVVAHVRGTRDRRDPVGDCGARDVEALVERASAVVQTRQDVRMQVDHNPTSTM